jgi:glycosyltransferase involved in cell wall biosynthesis
VSLKGDVERFAAELSPARVLWLPPFAEDRYQPRQAETNYDLLFVGTVNPETTPQRHDFLQRLGREFPGLAVRRGDFAELLPRASVALNIAERGDLNFRVFEALACGACLLTPRIGNGQDELFEDGVHFVTYEADDEVDAAVKARSLLADGPRREAYGRAGFARVDGFHRPRHRAEALAALLRQGFDEGLPEKRLACPDRARMADLRLLFLHWADTCQDPSLAARYLAEARRLSLAAG